MTHVQLLVQSLQGTRAQILFAFLFAGHAMDVDELRTWTGRDRKTHYGHLNALCVVGLLARQTAAHGRDVYVLGSEMLPALQTWVAQLGSPALELSQMSGNRTSVIQESVFRTPAALNVVVDDLSLNVPTITTTTTTGQESVFRTPAELGALTQAFRDHKIIGSKRVVLLACEWVNADYVHACVQEAKDENLWDNPVGMAISRMLEEHPMPQGKKESGLDAKLRSLRERSRHVEGRYPDYVEESEEL